MAGEPRLCCEGFSRSQALRRALASGRPRSTREWDPRMPIPAGAGVDRRRFLLGAAGGLVSVYGAERLGLTGRVLGDGIAQAATIQDPDSPVLVSVFLQGGIDALSVLAPAGNGASNPSWQLVPAQWKTVTLRGNCQFLEYITQKVLPLISTKDAKYIPLNDCSRLGGIGLYTKVLVPAQ